MPETRTNVGAGRDVAIRIGDGSIQPLTELQHRVKNLFVVIRALALRSLSGDASLEEARQTFIGRLEALARADQRILDSARTGSSLNELVRTELEPFPGQVKVDGLDVMLNPSAARNFALAVHELATNASKYGALSVPPGTVIVSWAITAGRGGETLVFRWRECGGPKVVAPARAGFGTSLLKAALGEVCFDYAHDGFRLEARLPLAKIAVPESWRCDRAPAQAPASPVL